MGAVTGNSLLRTGVLLLLAVLTSALVAQEKFTINGRLKVESGSLAGSRLVVYKNGEKHRVISTDLNRFSLDLDLNENYLLSFEKDGFVTKKLSFKTTVPAGSKALGYTPFDFVVSLFKQYDGVNIVVFNQPVGLIRYDRTIGDFDYDTDYTKSIQSALDAAQAEVIQKQKEEARKEEEARKQREQERKASAKAETKAAKEAAQQAKAQARQEALEAKAVVEEPRPVAPPEPEPEPVAPSPRTPRPKPPVYSAGRTVASVPKPVEGSDMRRALAPVMGHEPSPIQPATPRMAEEARPLEEAVTEPVVRHKDVIVQPHEVVTVIRVEQGDRMTEYRRVARKYSGVFYFKNGKSCSQLIYEQEALAEN